MAGPSRLRGAAFADPMSIINRAGSTYSARVKPYADNTVTFRMALAGYRAAVKRYNAGRLTQDVAATYHPLFEALNWSVALDDQIRTRWSPHGKSLNWGWRDEVEGGQYVRAVRFARNRVHHQWADALELTTDGATVPFTIPMVLHEWSWRRSTDLPTGEDSRDQSTYDRLLANHPARYALQLLDETYAQVADLLERPQTPDPIASGER